MKKVTRAINKAIETVLEQYPVPQYLKTTALGVVGGIVTLPSDCNTPVKLFDPDSDGRSTAEYNLTNQNDFDDRPDHSYTITSRCSLSTQS